MLYREVPKNGDKLSVLGLLGKLRSLFAATMPILVISAILVLIVDLDRPPYNARRLLGISQAALVDLQRDIR